MSLLRNVFIIVYLLIQVALPIRALVLDRYDTRGHFSWNMYSQNYDCNVSYRLTKPEGKTVRIKHQRHLRRKSRVDLLYYRDVLPEFHRYLCEHYRDRGELEALHGDVACTWNGQPAVPLVDREVDLCQAENYGVLRP